MTWTVERIINFQKDKLWGQGHVHYGFHDSRGNRYFFNLYIADTDNHVIRMVDGRTGVISTIAGRQAIEPHRRNDPNETDPFKLNIPNAAALDYHHGRLFIPEWDGDLTMLRRSP